MHCTVNSLPNLYRFEGTNGKTYRTQYSPRELAQRPCCDALDEKGNLRLVQTNEVNLQSFAYRQPR